ncbi:MAG TPA: MgtC/SapB family protein [Candidatus Pelethousia gallinarum]|nr:MgtC/SapB family protein [Candidatus Pelethousia gallinarum]
MDAIMTTAREFTYLEAGLRILMAIVLGGMIGMERGLKNRPAGLRTYMLVCLGACIVMLTNQYVYEAFGVGDPVRMGAQVVSGIGFLGAGTIIVTARNQIKGLTTAAGLWASACVGLALGIGLYAVSIMGSVAIFVILTLLHELDFRMRRSTKQVEVYVELKHNVAVGQFLDFVRDRHYEPSNLQILLENTSDNGILAFSVTLKGQKNCNHDDIVTTVKTMPGIGYVEEL